MNYVGSGGWRDQEDGDELRVMYTKVQTIIIIVLLENKQDRAIRIEEKLDLIVSMLKKDELGFGFEGYQKRSGVKVEVERITLDHTTCMTI